MTSPTAAELVAAVREFLESAVPEDAGDDVRFHMRIAANVLGMVEREVLDASRAANRHAAGLTTLGYPDDAALAAAIRSGGALPPDEVEAVTAIIRADVEFRLDLADPSYRHDTAT